MTRANSMVALAGLALAGCSSTSLRDDLLRRAATSTIIVAHRGDSGAFPENTIPAFAAALRTGADLVELDFYQTEDRVLVCFHDSTLDRTTDAACRWQKQKTRIAECTYAELADLDAGSWKDHRFAGTRIPTLESALRLIQEGSITMIEHKAGEPELLVALLRRLDLVEDVLVQSFDWKFLADVYRLEPRILLAALGGRKSQPHPEGDVLRQLRATRAAMVHWSFKRLRPEDVRRLSDEGFLVCVYTVNHPEDLERAIAMGVDAITTDYPARLRALLCAR